MHHSGPLILRVLNKILGVKTDKRRVRENAGLVGKASYQVLSWQYTVSPHKHVYLHCHITAFVVSQGITKDLMLLEVNSENCMLT